jgi:hypothetical protein
MTAYLWTMLALHTVGLVTTKPPIGRLVCLVFAAWEIVLIVGMR